MKKILIFFTVIIALSLTMCAHIAFGYELAGAVVIEEFLHVEKIGEEFYLNIETEPYENIGVQILYPSKSVEQLKTSALNDVFAYVGQLAADEDGIAKLKFTAASAVGEYTLRLTGPVDKVRINEEPFFAISWPIFDNEYFGEGSNIIDAARIIFNVDSRVGPEIYANDLKKKTDKMPAGKKALYLRGLQGIRDYAENHIWYDGALESVRQNLDEFFAYYKSIGGKINYVYLDYEFYLSVSQFQNDAQIYQAIEADDRYQKELRPLLIERGFVPYSGSKGGELYSLYTPSEPDYSSNRLIWDRVMRNWVSKYWNTYIYQPIAKHYPNVKVSEYEHSEIEGWRNMPAHTGAEIYLGGNEDKVGTHSNFVAYGTGLASVVNNPPYGYNKITYTPTPYHAMQFDIIRLKRILASDKDRKLQIWIAFEDFDASSPPVYFVNTPYYSENVLHAGLLNPDPFLYYGPKVGMPDDLSKEEQEELVRQRTATMEGLLAELNEVAGYPDRYALEKEYTSWNDSFMLSGMYAGGRRIWRITPDLSDGDVTLASFCIDEQTPTFSIKGKTITFPQGKILTVDAQNNTCGYWVETPDGVEPVMSYDDTFAANQTNIVNDGFSLGLLNSSKTISTNINRFKSFGKLPKKQVWETKVSVSGFSSSKTVNLFNYTGVNGRGSALVKLENSKVYAWNNGGYIEIPLQNPLSANTWYNVAVEIDFSSPNGDIYNVSVYTESGNLIGNAEGMVGGNMGSDTLLRNIKFSVSGYGTGESVNFGSVKMRPEGFYFRTELYDRETGIATADIPETKKLTVRFDYNNTFVQGNTEYVFLMAAYDADNSMQEIKILKRESIPVGEEGTFIADFDIESDNVSEVRFFVWDGFERIRPL